MKTNLEELLQPYQKRILTGPKYSAIKGAKKAIKFKRATRKELIACIKALLKKDWDCEWDGRCGIDPSIIAKEFLRAEETLK